MTMTLEQLRAMETRLVTALGDTTRAVFYDDFKRENRPISEVTAALDRVRAEIVRLSPVDPASSLAPRRILARHRCSL
ncbi:MAG TPA: hypothetical protein DIV82_00340 [Brevundimonas diminuta]|nr:hypothetical protein [Brevundimonas diminuta]